MKSGFIVKVNLLIAGKSNHDEYNFTHDLI